MSRRPKIKECRDPACSAEFTGRGDYCEWHRAGRDPATTSAIKFRRARKAEQQRRRRRAVWDAQYVKSPLPVDPSTGVKSPLHITAGQGLTKVGHPGQGVSSIPVLREDGATWTGDPAHPTPIVFYAPANIPDHAGVEPCSWCGWPVSLRSINFPAHSPACADYLGQQWQTPRRGGPAPIDVTGTPGMTISRAVHIFMIKWAEWSR